MHQAFPLELKLKHPQHMASPLPDGPNGNACLPDPKPLEPASGSETRAATSRRSDPISFSRTSLRPLHFTPDQQGMGQVGAQVCFQHGGGQNHFK